MIKFSLTNFAFSTITAYSSLQKKLIEHSLPYIHKYGWTDQAILAACTNLDLSPASHRIIQPYDIIVYSMDKWNAQALQTIDDNNFNHQKRIRDKIHYAIKTRLSLQLQYIDTWHQAMKIGAHPQNFMTTKDLLWKFSDQVWYRCGDRSTDYNYYTKRTLFNTAYASTQLHLLTDQSSQNFATWEFLDRRLDDILTVGKGVGNLKTVAGAAIDGLFSLTTIFNSPPLRKNEVKQESKEKQEQNKN